MSGSPLLIYLVTEDYYFWSHRLPMARAAQAAGFRVAVATRVRDHGERIAAAGFQVMPLQWQRRHNRPWTVLRDILEIAALYRRERPALVHHVAMKPTLFGGIAAWLAGVPAVINALNGLGTIFLSSNPLLAPARHVLAWVLGHAGCRLLVQNSDDAGFLISHGFVAAEQVTVIRGSGIDTTRFAPLPEPPESAPITAAFVGRMLEDKGVLALMEAHRQVRARGIPLRLLLVGTPDPDNPTSLAEETLHAWAREPGVEWRGQVEDVRTIWAEAHIAVLPSRREGLPKSLLEAAACARALVATDVPGCREIARAGENAVLVPRDDAGALADALATLATDSGLRARYAAASRALVLSDLAAEAVGAQVGALYRTMAGQVR